MSIPTVTGGPNAVLAIDDANVWVAINRSPHGEPVPNAAVQAGVELLSATDDELEISTTTLGHRSSFIGAVLLTLPGAVALRSPIASD